MSEKIPLELGQVRGYMEPELAGRKTDDMVILAFNESRVIARPVPHKGPEYLDYRRDYFEEWYPRVVQQ